MQVTEDLRIKDISHVLTPGQIHNIHPIDEQAASVVSRTRAEIHDILSGKDDRLLVIVGPCSIHDPRAAKEYAKRLLGPRESLRDQLVVVMRVYFEKPRTTVGWKGLINDPELNGSFNINKGLQTARELLLALNTMGIPAGTEFLDVVTPQYLTDLVSWGAIGARTTESQIHRELASGLSCPIGFKNGTTGDVQIAIDAIRAARHPHCFLALTQDAHSAIFETVGNEDTHMILRGGKEPNYDASSVSQACERLASGGLECKVMIDFSHANSRKQPERQIEVCADVAGQISSGDDRIFGVMLESHLVAGRQDAPPGATLTYGMSITDGCIGWSETETLLEELASAVSTRRERLRAAKAS